MLNRRGEPQKIEKHHVVFLEKAGVGHRAPPDNISAVAYRRLILLSE
jgi:hypothetical protein